MNEEFQAAVFPLSEEKKKKNNLRRDQENSKSPEVQRPIDQTFTDTQIQKPRDTKDPEAEGAKWPERQGPRYPENQRSIHPKTQGPRGQLTNKSATQKPKDLLNHLSREPNTHRSTCLDRTRD